MKIHAYPEIYLNKAQTSLGDAFDYAVNCCSISGEEFAHFLCASAEGKSFENGNPAIISGQSGIELAMDIIYKSTGKLFLNDVELRMNRTREYWIGWALAYYQWYSCRSFSSILKAVPYEKLELMYNTLHEADISKFAEIMDSQMHEFYKETSLKRRRRLVNCTQTELAERSGVSLRSIQMYEQRNKDINKASAETLFRLAKALYCSMEDLIEL